MKAQTSLEFLFFFTFVLFLFSASYVAVIDQEFQVLEEEVVRFAESIANQVSFELNLAWLQGPVFARNVTFPADIGGTDYNISVTNGTVQVTWEDRIVIARTVAPVHGTITSGTNRFINNGTHVVVK